MFKALYCIYNCASLNRGHAAGGAVGRGTVLQVGSIPDGVTGIFH
jgi:hypothetical protein